MTDPPHDGRVIADSVRHRDRFAVIFDRHAATIHRYLARRVGADAAEDVLAETFLTAFRRRDRFDTARGDARPWLYGIAATLLVDHLRREERQRRPAPFGPETHEHTAEVDDRVSAQSQQARLRTGLAQLPAAEREVLLLIAWEELSYAEVAEALDIPIGTVRSRLHRARQQIRLWLAATEPLQTAEVTTWTR